eukprot:Skav208939  [mRNA]  locus=scaffold1880:7784:12359:+ [translate_table: standard]
MTLGPDGLSPFRSILRAADMYGAVPEASQDIAFESRANLLIDIKEQVWGPTPFIRGIQMIQQGANSKQTMEGVFPGDPDRPSGPELVKVMWMKGQPMPKYEGKIMIRNIHDMFPTPFEDTSWAIDATSQIFPLKSRDDGKIRLLELFGGGYGGWSFAARFLREVFQVPFQIITVERSWEAAINFAATHGATVIDGTSMNYDQSTFEDGKDYVICADITDTRWQDKVAHWRPDIISASAPCQKWSTGGFATGLKSESGRLLPESILIIRRMRPKVATLEQVPGFPSHKHAMHVLAQLRAASFDIKFAKVVNAKYFGAAHRPRWLCLATVRHDPDVTVRNFVPWTTSCATSPGDMDSVVAWPEAFLAALAIPQDAFDMAHQAKYLPREQRLPYLQDGQHVFKTRCYTEKEVQPVIMARYGYQHELSTDLLLEKGYFASFFVHKNEKPRFLHPIELALIHTTWKCFFTCNFLGEAWEHIGNLITMPHSLLMLSNAVNQVGKHEELDIQQIMQAMWDHRLTVTNSTIKTWPEGIAIMHADEDQLNGNFYFHYQQARELCKQGRFPTEFMWHRDTGFQSLQLPAPEIVSSAPEAEPEERPCSQTTLIDEVSQTQPFPTMQRGTIRSADMNYSFWFEDSIPLADLKPVWDHRYSPYIVPQDEVTSLNSAVQLEYDPNPTIEPPSRPVVAFVHHQHLNLYSLPHGTQLKEAIQDWAVPHDVVDQNGEILQNQKSSGVTLLLPKHAWKQDHKPATHPAHALVGFQELTSHVCMWNPDDQSFCIHGKGPYAASASVANMWVDLLPKEILKELCLTSSAAVHQDSFQVWFRGYNTTCPVPPNCFWKLLSSWAMRYFLDSLASEAGQELKIVFATKILWSGRIASNTTMDQLINILTCAMLPLPGTAIPRLIAHGKQQFGTAMEVVKKSSTTETILKKAGHAKVQAVAQLPAGKQRTAETIQLCHDCRVEIPEVETRRAAKTIATQQSQKQRRLQPVPPDPTEYRIEKGFLLHQDGTQCEQIQGITSQACGVVLFSPVQAEPWLRESQQLSKDELAIFVVGRPTIDTCLPKKDIMLPCRNHSDQQVILAGTIIQLGSRHVKTIEDVKGQVELKNSTIVACTVWRSDWNPEEWKVLLKNTMQQFRNVLGTEANKDAIINTWGRSLRANGKPADDTNAESIQIHGTFRDDMLEGLLAKSGFNKVYMNPKGSTGRPSDAYCVIWVGGDLAKATSCAAKTQSCLGLVRGKNSLGLRYKTDAYSIAWQTLFPDEAIPEQTGGIHSYKIENLPYGCDAKILETWAKQYGWTIRGLKALGARAWLATTGQPPPNGILLFNGTPVITRFLPPKARELGAVVVAGPRPVKGAGKGGANQLQGDPWADYRDSQGMPLSTRAAIASAPSHASRSVDGPIETKFAQQDSRMKQMEETITKIAHAQETLKNDTAAGFRTIEQRDGATREFVQTSLAQFKTDMEKSVSHVIENQTQKFNDNISDLKKLMMQSIKRSREKGEEDMDSS